LRYGRETRSGVDLFNPSFLLDHSYLLTLETQRGVHLFCERRLVGNSFTSRRKIECAVYVSYDPVKKKSAGLDMN